jgi:general secretion pathway protein F
MRYRSTFLEADGSAGTAVIDADDEQSLHDHLSKTGRLLIKAAPAAARESRVRMPARKLMAFTQAMETSLEAGVSLLAALDSMRAQEPDPKIAGVLTALIDRVSQGESLAESMAAHPRCFSSLYVAMISAGEASGSLDRVFAAMGGFLEWRQVNQISCQTSVGFKVFWILEGVWQSQFISRNQCRHLF